MIRILLSLMSAASVLCNSDAGKRFPLLVHPDPPPGQTYDNVPDYHPAIGSAHGSRLPMSQPAADVSPADNVACVPGCSCAGSQLRPTVSCSSLNLTKIPDGLSHLTTYLDLSGNNISSFPDYAFSEYRFLNELNLNQNRLSWLPENLFTGIVSLRMLYIADNQLTSFPEAVSKLQHLIVLYINHNKISSIASGAFDRMTTLDDLWLHNNRLTEVPTGALRSLQLLSRLTLAENQIEEITEFAFRNLSNLRYLIMFNNRISAIHPHAFDGLTKLLQLELDGNELTTVPNLSFLEELRELSLSHNKIAYLPDDSFANNKKLSTLRLNNNPITSYGKNVFSDLPFLPHLMLSEVRNQKIFPNLTGSRSLQTVELDRAQILAIPDDLCVKLPKLVRFDIHSNRISRLPDFSACKQLLTLNLGNNDLTTLHGQLFKSLTLLQDLTLFRNHIEYIPADAFVGLSNLKYLDLQHNRIQEIHEDAFVPLKSLEDLNLGENLFSVLPTNGLQKLKNLKTFGNQELKDFPHPDTIPQIHLLTLSYAYHCCEFIRTQNDEHNEDAVELSEDIIWLPDDSSYDVTYLKNFSSVYDGYPEILNQLYDNYPSGYDFNYSDYYQLATATNRINDYRPKYDAEHIKIARPPIICKPMPGPFMPCDDLMGWWSLRCGVWVVFLLAVLGNGTVLLVSITSRSKMDVPRFLICNLACADFFMGIYLGFLAVVDASTLGEFKKYAIKWQTSPGCQIAGFLGVLSSELSVFTLTVITLERFYAITHAMHLNKRMSIRKASYTMGCGWFVAIVLGIMPQYGISDFRKFAICLPFEIGDSLSLGYVCFIMLMNCIAFLIIVSCYVKMYWSIRGSQAWNSNDTRVAKRMALLVFTDFACWAPISFFSLTAAFGHELISLNDAKVFAIFVLPLNSCANPFLYAIFTKQFKKDCNLLCKRLEESAANRSLSRASNRNNISATWGSSRRPSALNSFFISGNEENKRQGGATSGRHYVPPESCDSVQSTFSRLNRLFSLRRTKSERNVREPLELSRYGPYQQGRGVHFSDATNDLDVLGRSEPSSSAASAPPDTGNRCLIKKKPSHGSILFFWKRWYTTPESRELNSFQAAAADVRQRESANDHTTSSSSQIQVSGSCVPEPSIRMPRKYTSPYGRKKLRRKRMRPHRCRPDVARSGSCCCASGRGTAADLDSPIDNPHPSITDDSSGEIMSSGLSDRLSFSESDISVCFRPLPCSLQPIDGLDRMPGSPLEAFRSAEPLPRERPCTDNNNHEYVNMTMDVMSDVRDDSTRTGWPNRAGWNEDVQPKLDQPFDGCLLKEDTASSRLSYNRSLPVSPPGGHPPGATSNSLFEIDSTSEINNRSSTPNDGDNVMTNGLDVDDLSADDVDSLEDLEKFDSSSGTKVAEGEEPPEDRPLLSDRLIRDANKSEGLLSLATKKNEARTRKTRSCDITELSTNGEPLCSYKPICQTSPNLSMLTHL